MGNEVAVERVLTSEKNCENACWASALFSSLVKAASRLAICVWVNGGGEG
jgi:hypothetical protein